MAGPSVNILLRVDSTKVKEDLEKTRGVVQSAVSNVATQFFAAEKVIEGFKKAVELSAQALVFLSDRTGAMQSLNATLAETRRAIGEAADRSGALRETTRAFEDAARDVASFMRSAEGRQAINDFFAAISLGAAAALDAMNGVLKVGSSLARMFLAGAPEGTRAAAMLKGLNDVNPQGETPFQALLTRIADRARGGVARPGDPGYGVLAQGSYRDDEAIKAAEDRRKRAEAEAKAQQTLLEQGHKAGQALLKFLEDQRKAEHAAGMRSLDSKRMIADLTRQVEEGKTETAMSNAKLRADIAEKEADAMQRTADRQATVGGLILDGASYTSNGIRQLEEDSKKFDESTKMAAQAGLAVSGTLSSVFTAMAQAIGSGEDIGKAVTAALGGAIASLGASAIAAGTYAVVMGTLSLAFPLLQAAFPSSGIPAGLAAIGLGGAMLAGGTYLASIASGGSASGPARGSATSGGGGYRTGNSVVTNRRTGFSGTPEGFASTSLAPVTNVFNYNFNGPMGGSPRRIAREIRDLSTAGDTLLPGYRSPGGR